MKDFFFTQDRLLKPGPIRGIYFMTFAAFFVLTEVGREIYRPYIYQNDINDWGLADVVGNLLGTVAIIFVNLAVYHATRKQSVRVVVAVTLGAMA